MAQQQLDRRIFLARVVLAGAGAAAMTGGPAAALRIEDSNAAREALMLRACETRSAHDRIVRELIAEIQGVEPAKAEEMVKAMTCPLCGCKLSGEAPAGPPRF